MNPKDFRIGNLIDRQDYICRVIKIDEDGIIVEPLNYKEERFVMQEINPIPITEKWLLKLGFKECHYSGHPMRPEKPCESNKYYYSPNGTLQTNFSISFKRDNPIWFGRHEHIKYVHQLQNLYYTLTGQDLAVAPPCP